MMEDSTKARRIAMSGATGFVGTYLRGVFQDMNWNVVPLGRKDFQAGPGALASQMKGADTVVNLAGAPIISRWTEEYKRTMYDSRVRVTQQLVQACGLMDPRPDLFISTSAIGYYDTRGTHTEEDHVMADDFLGHLARDWEGEAKKAQDMGMRLIIFRFGIVIGRGGGALQQMLKPFKMGLGGTIGDGSQAFSWIHIRDLAKAYGAAIENPAYQGTYNLTAPNPTTNKGLTKALGRALGMPAVIHVPQFLLRLQLGEGARVLTTGQTVLPKRLLESRFTFDFTHIEEAVQDCLS